MFISQSVLETLKKENEILQYNCWKNKAITDNLKEANKEVNSVTLTLAKVFSP